MIFHPKRYCLCDGEKDRIKDLISEESVIYSKENKKNKSIKRRDELARSCRFKSCVPIT